MRQSTRGPTSNAMLKIVPLAVLLVFQVSARSSISERGFFGDNLETDLENVNVEVEDFTRYLDARFPNSHHAIGTITWQCHGVAEIVQNVINAVKRATEIRHGERTFKQFAFALQEVHTSLQQIALSTDVNEVTSIKFQMIANLQLARETLEKMVRVTYVHYPDFRLELETILIEFLHGLRAIGDTLKTEPKGIKFAWSPKELGLKIECLSQGLSHRSLGEGFADGVRRILDKLHATVIKKSVGDNQLDVVLLRLAGELRQKRVDLAAVATVFKQLIHYIENGSQGEQGDHFVQEVLYDYYHVLKGVYLV